MLLSYFYLPKANGGLADLVRQTVFESIEANSAAGVPVGKARDLLAAGDASFAAKDYKGDYDNFGKAYREPVK